MFGKCKLRFIWLCSLFLFIILEIQPVEAQKVVSPRLKEKKTLDLDIDETEVEEAPAPRSRTIKKSKPSPPGATSPSPSKTPSPATTKTATKAPTKTAPPVKPSSSSTTPESLTSEEPPVTENQVTEPILKEKKKKSFYNIGPKLGLIFLTLQTTTSTDGISGYSNGMANLIGASQVFNFKGFSAYLDLGFLPTRLSYPSHLSTSFSDGLNATGLLLQTGVHLPLKTRESYWILNGGMLNINLDSQITTPGAPSVQMSQNSLPFVGVGLGAMIKNQLQVHLIANQYLSALPGQTLFEISGSYLF